MADNGKGPNIIGGDPEVKPDLMAMGDKVASGAKSAAKRTVDAVQDAAEDAGESLSRTFSDNPDSQAALGGSKDNANLIYILYLVNFFVPFLGIVGVIMAYSARDAASPELRSHYDNQIRIFWTTCIAFAISFVLMLVLIGILTAFATMAWKVMRCATALSLLNQSRPVSNVKSLSFVSE